MTEVSAKELKNTIKVIKAIKKLGVRKLKLGTLEFELAENTLAPNAAFKASTKKQKAEIDKQKVQLEFNSASDDLSVMHVEDPVGFERALIEQDIDDTDEISEGKIEEARHSQID